MANEFKSTSEIYKAFMGINAEGDINGSGILGKAQDGVDDALAALGTSEDASNPLLLLKSQKAINEWTVTINTASSMLKSLRDVAQGITQKM